MENYYKLSNVCDIITGKLDANQMVENGKYPFYTCDRNPYRIDTYAFDCECILIGGNNASGNFPINYYKGKFNAYQRTYIVKMKNENNISIRYIYHALKEILRGLKRRSRGSLTKFLTIGLLENIKIPKLPDLMYSEIANKIDIYEKIIANNNELASNLEEYSQLLFHKWFVDFNFPDKSGNPYKDGGGEMVEVDGKMIPKNWKRKKINYFVEGQITGDWGNEEPKEGLNEVLCVRGADLPDWKIGKTHKTPVRYIDLEKTKDKQFRHGDVMIEISGGSPIQSTGRILIIRDSVLSKLKAPVYCSNFSKIIRPKDIKSGLFLGIALQKLYNRGVFFHYESKTTGIKNLLLPKVLDRLKIVVPNEKTMDDFNEIVGPLYDKIYYLGYENELLEETRDLLIKKLIK